MKSTDMLDSIWQAYQTTNDCLKIARRSIDKQKLDLLNKTKFMTLPIHEANLNIENSRKNADDYVILSLWIVFERHLFDYLTLETQRILINNPSILTQKVHEKIDYELEYWRIDDVLDIFKTIIDPHIIGQVKQIKKYRDWLAHKNPKKPIPQIVTPRMAYTVLSEVTQLIEASLNIN